MAYLDLAQLDPPGYSVAAAVAAPAIVREAARPALGARARIGEGTLSPLEWTVVSIARRDRMSSLREPAGKWVRRIASLFALPHDPRLADPRLEALRRISVLSWHRGYAIAPSEVRAFLRAGWSAAQYDLVAGHAVATRAADATARHANKNNAKNGNGSLRP